MVGSGAESLDILIYNVRAERAQNSLIIVMQFLHDCPPLINNRDSLPFHDEYIDELLHKITDFEKKYLDS